MDGSGSLAEFEALCNALEAENTFNGKTGLVAKFMKTFKYVVLHVNTTESVFHVGFLKGEMLIWFVSYFYQRQILESTV